MLVSGSLRYLVRNLSLLVCNLSFIGRSLSLSVCNLSPLVRNLNFVGRVLSCLVHVRCNSLDLLLDVSREQWEIPESNFANFNDL